MKKLIAGAASACCLAIVIPLGLSPVDTAATAQAMPNQCARGYGPLGNGGAFCDYDQWADGSFMHWERVCVLGFCGENTFRACHVPGGRVPADYDPHTPC